MAYKFYTDRNETFECKISVKNASLKNSIARLIIETDECNLIFNGKISDNKCIIPVKKLKGLLEENTTGKAKLELILEDTYFNPWTSDCIIEQYSKIEINEVKNDILSKPIVEASIISQEESKREDLIIKEKNDLEALIIEEKTAVPTALMELNFIFDILKVKKIKNNKETLEILNEFFRQNTEYKQFKKNIITEFFKRKIFK